MEEGNYAYIVIAKDFMNGFFVRAICMSEEQLEDYKKYHDMKNCRVMVINLDHPKANKFGDLEEILYNNSAIIDEYYDDIPLTVDENIMLSEHECTFHQHMLSQMSAFMNVIEKGYINFSKREMKDIQIMLDIIKKKNQACLDEDYDDEEDWDACERINYKELIIQSQVLR